MAVPGYIEFKDSEGNAVEGSVKIAGREGMCEVMEFDHTVRIPTDSQMGTLTGVRQHRPMQVVKPYDRASPLLYDMLCNGETLSEVILHWYHIDDTGTEVEYFRHTLKDGKISDINAFMYNTKDPQKEQFTHMERVSILYGEITWQFMDGNIEYVDSWVSAR
ncbi:MAG: type VI secretion system tube protein Hcp [Bacteroidetes bacterium]|jgi:type VI secretion system secreted protein Hcp|nr:type VI secretion system tube protein Hcp [Bacteroidota bacterium]